MEKWKPIPNYEGLYEASNLGRIRSLDRYVLQQGKSRQLKRGRILRPAIDMLGYVNVALSNKNKLSSFKVHRLVALSHLPNPQKLREVNHKDCNKENNCAENLEWCTHFENMRHAVRNNLITYRSGYAHHNTKITDADTIRIRDMYYVEGKRVSEIKKVFKVHFATIYRIIEINKNLK